MNTLFNNTEVAFALKSDTELERAYFLFKLIDAPDLPKPILLIPFFEILTFTPGKILILLRNLRLIVFL